MKSSKNELLARLSEENNIPKRRLLLLAYLTEKVETNGIVPVLVGGGAVEVYTFGDYQTKDIDLVFQERQLIGLKLEELDFEKKPGMRHWYHAELDIAIEIPDDVLAGEMEKVSKIEINGGKVYVIGLEDLIIDRLNAAVFWRSTSDKEQAFKVLTLHYEEIDFDYLDNRARDEKVEILLAELKEKAKKILQSQ